MSQLTVGAKLMPLATKTKESGEKSGFSKRNPEKTIVTKVQVKPVQHQVPSTITRREEEARQSS
ncbi:hypothetical protein DID78_05325 [Candidatus Marinamargulisbacteria bacterium SCGC AG-343-D04]|nr:hypothetical protein DID78_05325 [Candidatus Marinamargulisbacteria bacterium SCGC AG-343-D04]